jgi:hypothetical protein
LYGRDMERRAHRRGWLIGVFVALMANQAFAAAGTLLFVCSGDQVARLECCCPRMTEARPARQQVTQLEAPCCCQVTRAVAPVAPAAAASDARLPTNVFLASLAPPTLPAPSAPPATFSNSWAQPPPPAPVTILLQKQSFLI